MWTFLNNTLYFAHCISNNLFTLDGYKNGTYECKYFSNFNRCVVGNEPILHGAPGQKLDYNCIYDRHVSIYGNDELLLPKTETKSEYVSIKDMNHSMVTELKEYPNVTYFLNEYWSKIEPVVMKDSLIMRNDWNSEYISSKMGHIIYNERPISEILETKITSEHYRNWEVPESMYGDIEIPKMLRSKFFMKRFEKIVMWVSGGNTVSPLHRDAGNFYIGQIKGIKHIYLLNPLNSISLYADIFAFQKSYGSTFDPLFIDIMKYPLAKHMSIKKCTLYPGDVLFLPEYTWHVVISDPGENVGITMQFHPYLLPSSHFSVSVANEFANKRFYDFQVDSLNGISEKWHSETFRKYDTRPDDSWACKDESSPVNFESNPHDQFCKCFERSNDEYWTQNISTLIEHQWFSVRLSVGECMKAAMVDYTILLEILKCEQISSRWIALNTFERIMNDFTYPLLSVIIKDITELINYEKPGTKWIAMKALSFISSLGISMDSTLVWKLLPIINTDFGFPSVSVAAIELILQVYKHTDVMNDIIEYFKTNLKGDALKYAMAQANQAYLNSEDEFDKAEKLFLDSLTDMNHFSMWNAFFLISAHRQTSLEIRKVACALIIDKNSNFLSRYMALKYIGLFDDDAALDVVARALDDSICALRFTASEILQNKFKLEYSHIRRILKMMASYDEYTRFVASFTIRRCAQRFCQNIHVTQEIIASLIGFTARNGNDASILRTIRSIENAMLRCSDKYTSEPVSTKTFEIATLQTHHIPALRYDNHCCINKLADSFQIDHLLNNIDTDCNDIENLDRLSDRGFVVIRNFMNDMSEINTYLKTAQNYSKVGSRVLMGRKNMEQNLLPYTTAKLKNILDEIKAQKQLPSSKLHGEGSEIHAIDFILIDPDSASGSQPDWHVDGPGDFNGFKRRIFKMWMLQQQQTYQKTGIKLVSMKTLNNICEQVNYPIPLVRFGTCTNQGLDQFKYIYDRISCTPNIKEGDLILWHPGIVHRTQDYDTRRVSLLGEVS